MVGFIRNIGQKLAVLVLSLSVFAISAQAGLLASCNYNFDVGPHTYDRGSVQVFSDPGNFWMQMVVDDVVSRFDRVNVSTANGDQARAQFKDNKDFRAYVTEAKVYMDEVTRVDAYVVGPIPDTVDPQARFYAFFGQNNQFLGGFGTFGKINFVCDWVSSLK
jgi:hypothetical protein